MRNRRFVKNFKIMIKVTINLNNKLYKKIIKKIIRNNISNKKNYINYWIKKVKFKVLRTEKRLNKTILIKLNAILFKKFKNKNKKPTKKQRIIHVIKEITILKIAN